MPQKSIYVKNILLLLLISIVIINLQYWVGNHTIYKEALEGKRQFLHDAIYNNEIPTGKTWENYGAKDTNRRIFVVYLAAGVSKGLNIHVLKVYKMIDTVFLFLFFAVFYCYLRKWLDNEYCLIALLFLGNVFITTFQFYYFHPWDRISLFSWLILIWLIRERKEILLVFVLIISITIKFDVIVLPIFYFLYNYLSDPHKRLLIIIKSILLLIMTIGMHEVLNNIYSQADALNSNVMFIDRIFNLFVQIKINIRHLINLKLSYPPLLMFLLPLSLSFIKWKEQSHFMRASVIFGILILIMQFPLVNFKEVRAQCMVLILLLPSAMLNLKFILNKS